MNSFPAKKIVILSVVTVPFLATLFAIWLLWDRAVNATDLTLLAVMYSLVALGVTVGFHRMLTHRSFRPHPIVKFILLVLGSMALEGPALSWAATHIKHHAHSDREGDPHSPVDGFWHAHFGWLFKSDYGDPNVYCRNLVKDPIVVFVCHTFGKREFETKDQSRNEWIVGLLAFGEGWHNNHHAFPRSAFHGLHWWQFDLSGYIIWTLERFGLARDVYRVPSILRARYFHAMINVEQDVPDSIEMNKLPENTLV